MAECIPIYASGLNLECRNTTQHERWIFGHEIEDKSVELAYRIAALEISESFPLFVDTIGHIDHVITTIKENLPLVIPTIESIFPPKKGKYNRKIDISKRRRK